MPWRNKDKMFCCKPLQTSSFRIHVGPQGCQVCQVNVIVIVFNSDDHREVIKVNQAFFEAFRTDPTRSNLPAIRPEPGFYDFGHLSVWSTAVVLLDMSNLSKLSTGVYNVDQCGFESILAQLPVAHK